MIIIAGPCAMESKELLLQEAECLSEICQRLGIEIIFKSSFDKANRTSIYSYRGPGIEKGMEWMGEIKNKFHFQCITDIHEPWQAKIVAEVCDYIQIPAFLCRQTDLLIAAAKTGKTINVKKAQFLAPWDMINVVRKLEECGNHNIILCERGSTFGYNQLVVDMTSISEMKKTGYPVIFDATHSVQRPGGNGTSTGGNRQYVEPLAMAAVAAGADGLFFEVHPDPDKALSDGPNMIPLHTFERLLLKVNQIYDLVNGEIANGCK